MGVWGAGTFSPASGFAEVGKKEPFDPQQPLNSQHYSLTPNPTPSALHPVVCRTGKMFIRSGRRRKGAPRTLTEVGKTVPLNFSSAALLLSSLELRDTKVYGPQIRALLEPLRIFVK